MANDVKLQSPEGKHPVDENLRPILVGGKATAIETAQHGNGVKVNGDFEATGETKGITASQISYPAFFRFNGNHGVHFNRNNLVSGSILFGDDSTSLLLRSAPGGTDYLSFQVALNGKTTISTIDFVGNEADLVIVVDGYIDMNSASGEDITLDSGDDIYVYGQFPETEELKFPAVVVQQVASGIEEKFMGDKIVFGSDVTQSSGELYGIGFMIHLITDKESKITVDGTDYKQRRLMNWLMLNIANALNDIDWDTYKEEELEIVERHVLAWNDIGHMGQLQWYGATCRMSVTFLNKR